MAGDARSTFGAGIGKRLYESDAIRSAYQWYKNAVARATTRFPIGTNVYTREWDLLLVLDTCRVDALTAVADEYDFLGEVGAITSVGSCSPEWIANTFTEQYRSEVERTAVVSANAHMERVVENRRYRGGTKRVVDTDAFAVLDQPWRYVPDEQKPFAHTPPRYVTDRAIAIGRERSPDRMVLHYSQPHSPYTARAVAEDRDLKPHEDDPFQALRDGTPYETVWDTYLDELRFVLDDVALLLENVDADRVAITADHGEGFGEYGVYSHPLGMPHPKIKRVPWTVTSATDTGSHEPDRTYEPGERTVRHDPEEQLAELGYLD